MRKSKNSPKVKTEEVKPTGFTLKFTNLRKTAYPDPLEKTDYYGIKPGDYLRKGSTIYEVTSIGRETISEDQYNKWNHAVNRYGRTVDPKFKDLIDEYKKKGNFGACRIGLKPVLRGSKTVITGRMAQVCELDTCPPATSSYRQSYQVIDLANLSQVYNYRVNREQVKLNRIAARVQGFKDTQCAIINLIDSKTTSNSRDLTRDEISKLII